MSPETPKLRAEPIEAETAKYNPEQIRDAQKRQETAQDIGRRKAEIKYDKATPEGRKTLSKEWIKKANLSEAQIKAINEELGIQEGDSEEVQDQKRSKWQSENGLGSGKDGKGPGDGILGWKTLEKLDAKITERVGRNDDSLSSNPDLNGLQHIDNEAEKTAEKEQMLAQEKKMSDFYDKNGSSGFDVAKLEEAGLNEVEYNTYATARKEKENTVDKNRLQTLKKAETDKNVRSGVIAAQEDGTSNDEFGGQKITFDKEKNGWKNADGEFLNTDTGEFVSKEKQEADKNAQLRELTDSLNGDLEGKEAVFGEYELVSKKFEDGTMGYEDKKSGKRLNLQTGKLETKEEREADLGSDLAKEAGDILVKHGTLKDYDLFGSKSVSEFKLGELGRGYEYKVGQITPEVSEKIKAFDAKIKPLLATHPKMAELTLKEYQQFQEKPESFASSNLIPKDGTAIDPNEYGIKSDFKYAQDSVGNKIKIPVRGDVSMDTIRVTDVAGNKEKSQREWLEGLVNDTSIQAGRDYVVAGSPNLMLRKEGERMIVFPAGGGDIQAEYKKGSGGEYAWAGETVEAGTLAQNN